jgi:environmental stress-induced protein Ves
MLERREAKDFLTTPWKNGGGSTCELWCDRPENYAARLSVATIAQSGPFSVFSGFARIIMQLDGGSVQLSGDVSHRLVPWAPFHFSGEQNIVATLTGNAARDFNVIYRPDVWRVSLVVASDLTLLREDFSHTACYLDRGQADVELGQKLKILGPTLFRTNSKYITIKSDYPSILVRFGAP